MECHLITWQEIKNRILKLDKSLKYYGVPRGGQYISAMLNPVDTPNEADIIIDDLIDSGKTKLRYELQYGKPFIGLFNKKIELNLKNKWLQFPWEENESPIEDNVTRILEYLGEDPNREGLKDTPKRYIKFLKEFTQPKEFNFTTFEKECYDEMILMDDINFYSLCEHHIAPFFGTAKIAYIPNKKVVGLSKLARCVDLYANKFQNQERITYQIAERLMDELDPLGVAVSLKAQHLCMSMRGVKKHQAVTKTTALYGVFKSDDKARNEFING